MAIEKRVPSARAGDTHSTGMPSCWKCKLTFQFYFRKGKKTRVEELRGSLDTADSDSSVVSTTSHEPDMSTDESEVASADSKRSTRSTRSTTSRAKNTRSTRARTERQEEPMKVSPVRSLKFPEVCSTIEEEQEVISSEEDKVDGATSKTPEHNEIAQLNYSNVKDSPKTIPGFGNLNVKAKAQAYEEFVSTTLNDSLNNSVSESKKSMSKGTPRMHTPRTPRLCHSSKVVSPSRSNADSRLLKSQATISISSGNKTPTAGTSPRSCRVVADSETPDRKRKSESRRSSVRGSLSNLRKSLSRRRSSVLREQLAKSGTKPSATGSPAVSAIRIFGGEGISRISSMKL